MGSNEWEIFSYVLISMALGGLIGFERGTIGKPAGIRTNMFVSGSAALVVSVSKVLIEQFSQVSSIVSADPTRILEAVIVGVSFIGAGTVLKSSETHRVYFLTTAASILFSAGVGIVVALGLIKLAIMLALLIVVISRIIGRLEFHFIYHDKIDTE
ncbi:MgtC/SapB family protein [Candidatus Saccharibacteria bacterium CPR2]|nr:MgtC/SapB family protein [Candidatus Saccharibacteria bacterium CPR2]